MLTPPPPHQQGPKRGSSAARTADADTKQYRVETDNRQGTPNTQPGEEGRGGGAGLAVEEDRKLPVRCLHSNWHTNRTLGSLNNVDCLSPPKQ